jgi:cbb3-type cytochrome oxidase subunit 3
MKQLALSYFEHIELTNLALILFLIAFFIVVFRVMSKGNKKLYEEMEQLPLEEEQYQIKEKEDEK